MPLDCSTRDIPLRDRINYWVEVATKAFVAHEFSSLNGPSYLGEIHAGWIGDLGVSRFSCDPCAVVRSARDIARDDRDDLLLCLQLSGRGYFEQDGRQDVNEPGSFMLIDARRPFSIVLDAPVRSITFKVSREGLNARLGNTSGMMVRSISAKGAVGGLVSGFLSMLPPRIDLLDAVAGAQLSEQALDLIALAFSAQADLNGAPSASQRAKARFRLKSVIEARLCDPHLKPAAIATEAGISVRYANDLLSQEGSSVERYVLHRRLERCRSALEDRAQAHRKIGEIAFGWGFSDLSHFARRFRDAYAMTPGECRQLALEVASIEEVVARHRTPK